MTLIFEVKRGIVLRNGAQYEKGSVFEADKSDVTFLINAGYIAPALVEEIDESDNTPPANDPQPDESGEYVDAPTIEQFSELKADVQKSILYDLGIEPGSNKEERIAQYTEWYESDPDGDPENDQDEDDLLGGGLLSGEEQ